MKLCLLYGRWMYLGLAGILFGLFFFDRSWGISYNIGYIMIILYMKEIMLINVYVNIMIV